MASSSSTLSTPPSDQWCYQTWHVKNFFNRYNRTQIRSPRMFYFNSNYGFQLVLNELYEDYDEDEDGLVEFVLLLTAGRYNQLEVKNRISILDCSQVERIFMGMFSPYLDKGTQFY